MFMSCLAPFAFISCDFRLRIFVKSCPTWEGSKIPVEWLQCDLCYPAQSFSSRKFNSSHVCRIIALYSCYSHLCCSYRKVSVSGKSNPKRCIYACFESLLIKKICTKPCSANWHYYPIHSVKCRGIYHHEG